ncbi:MAG: hypothetical protein ACOYD6_05495 [Limnochordia bacterium]
MAKWSKIYFLTAYFDYLLKEGIRSEEYYLSDASRYLRYLLQQSSAKDIDDFLARSGRSENYKRRLRKTLRKFYSFVNDCLEIPNNPFGEKRA